MSQSTNTNLPTANLTRRRVLQGMAATGGTLAAGSLLPGANAAPAGANSAGRDVLGGDNWDREAFVHSVASGDPTAESVIIWTRVTPQPDAVPGSGIGADVPVEWQVATDPEFKTITARGNVTASAEFDHTVKVDATGLNPATTYYYRFIATLDQREATSRVGRTRTAPGAGDDVSAIRFGVCSCSNYEAGFFRSYRDLADRDDLEFVLHLGDYTYEYETGGYKGMYGQIARRVEPRHITKTLADFRIRQGTYRQDEDLADLHAAKPMICIWDDHEFADNNWREGATGESFAKGQDYQALKQSASRAYFEWMPVRVRPDAQAQHLYRTLQYGPLLEIIIPDLRSYRDAQLIQSGDHWMNSDPDFMRAAGRENRTMMGRSQFEWFAGALSSSTAKWQIIANEVMFAPMTLPHSLDPNLHRWLVDTVGLPEHGIPLNPDQWDGYMAERQKIVDLIAGQPDKNVVFLTGDIHSSWASDIPKDVFGYRTGHNTKAVAAEFVTPSVTANGAFDSMCVSREFDAPTRQLLRTGQDLLTGIDRWFKWINFTYHGYMAVEVNQETTQCDWHFVDHVLSKDTRFRLGRSFQTRVGAPGARPVGAGLNREATVY